ncbi:hypothetical protein [Rhodospirillum sp. A1_3_36]|uniref:hypothetical protein n=1 Tax=Rhodospirillum sp. A1_3_36 TaxID=3391666 RepID=UPI0039A418E3
MSRVGECETARDLRARRERIVEALSLLALVAVPVVALQAALAPVYGPADDTLRPNALETLRTAFTDAQGNDPGRRTRIPVGSLTPQDLLFGHPAGTASNIAVRRDAFRDSGGFDTSLQHAEDQKWMLRMALRHPNGLVGLQTPLVNYRTGRQTLSASLKAMDEGWTAVVDRAAALDPRPGQTARTTRQGLADAPSASSPTWSS